MINIGELCMPSKDEVVVSKFVKILTEIDITESVFFVGSLVKGVYNKKKSGIDIVVLINDDSNEEDLISELSKRKLSFRKSDDIYILEDSLISIHIQRYDNYIFYLSSIIESEAVEAVIKDWAIGGVCREVILDDISSALVVYDIKGEITKLSKKLCENYSLGKQFGDSLILQLKNKMSLTVGQYYEKNIILFNIGFWECIELAERLFCHEKKIYNLGFKHVSKRQDFRKKFGLFEIENDVIECEKMRNVLDKIAVEFEIGV